MPKLKSVFTIPGIKPDKLDQEYNIKLTSNLNTNIAPQNCTPLKTIIHNKNLTKNYSFLDESKKKHLCDIHLVDHVLKQKLPKTTDVYCFWCRHSFSYSPIGCPIRYIPNVLTKRYYSNITHDYYTINQPLSKNDCKVPESKNADYTLIQNNYYETDGIFCSFNCCMSYINKNSNNTLYSQSKHLLHQIFFTYFKKNMPIKPAPDWRLLKDYGGNLSIQEFRNTFNRIEIQKIKQYINMRPIGWLYEKIIKL